MNSCFTHRVACLVRGFVWGAILPIAGAIERCTAQAASSEGAYTTAPGGTREGRIRAELQHVPRSVAARWGERVRRARARRSVLLREVERPTVEELFRYAAENMPPDQTRLSEAAYLDVIAYILQVLKYPAGTADLTRRLTGHEASHRGVRMPIRRGRTMRQATCDDTLARELLERRRRASGAERRCDRAALRALPGPGRRTREAEGLRAGDRRHAGLEPRPENWISVSATATALWGYSPLNQINAGNVGQLRLAWSRAMQPGPQEVEPIVYDGIMFLVNSEDIVQALDATNGDLLWEYRRKLPAKHRQPDRHAVQIPQRLDLRRQDLPRDQRRLHRSRSRQSPARFCGRPSEPTTRIRWPRRQARSSSRAS